MTLEEVFNGLAHGVLSNLVEGGDRSGTIPFEHEAKVLHHLNQALTTLHGRFLLQQKEVQLRTYDHIAVYYLEKKYADNDPREVFQKYISDSVFEPFDGDVIRVLEIYDECGCKVPFNDDTVPCCPIIMPNPHTLQFATPLTGNTYFIMYQARHRKILPGDLGQEVYMPDVLIPAMEAHVAYQIMSGMNGQENAAKAAEHMAKYEMVCEEVLNLDLVSTSLWDTPMKLHNRGFV